MTEYDVSRINDLREILYNSNAHDSIIYKYEYCWSEDKIRIILINEFFHEKIELIFAGIETTFVIKKKEFGSREAVVSLTVEDDLSYLYTYYSQKHISENKYIYIVLQMFSMDEIHIVSNKISVETMTLVIKDLS